MIDRLVAWLGRRFDATAPSGLALTATVAVAVLACGLFAGITQAVAAGDGVALLDLRAHAFVVAHRAGWLTVAMRGLTWLGSSYLLIPLLAVVSAVLLRRHDRSGVGWLWAAFLGVGILYLATKDLVHRARPPAADMIGHATGLAYPSGHATQAVATWGMLALVLAAGRSRRTRAWLVAVAAAIAVAVGASRVYLGAHWLTDVLAGWCLGVAWLAVLAAVQLRYTGHVGGAPSASRRVGAPPPPPGTGDGGRPDPTASVPAVPVPP